MLPELVANKAIVPWASCLLNHTADTVTFGRTVTFTTTVTFGRTVTFDRDRRPHSIAAFVTAIKLVCQEYTLTAGSPAVLNRFAKNITNKKTRFSRVDDTRMYSKLFFIFQQPSITIFSKSPFMSQVFIPDWNIICTAMDVFKHYGVWTGNKMIRAEVSFSRDLRS